MDIDWIYDTPKKIHYQFLEIAQKRQNCLIKPPGSLGDLEKIAVRLSGMFGRTPTINEISISVFVADHGIASAGVSAFSQSVTGDMIRNFSNGSAAICILAKSINANLEIINLGTVNDPHSIPGIIYEKIAPQTHNFLQRPAMDEEELFQALNIGREAAIRAMKRDSSLFIGGEMGIGNTTSATAISAAYTGYPAIELTGPGSGISKSRIAHKVKIINEALCLHDAALSSPLEVLRALGGFEIAGLVGAYISCAQRGIPILIDGFIATASALAAYKLNPGTLDWMMLSHASAEPGYYKIAKTLGLKPIINLDMKLGEGSGAAVTAPLIKMACELYSDMATFEEAGIS